MRLFARYLGAGAVVVASGVGAAWPWLSPAGQRGLAEAAAVALVVQGVAFAMVVRSRRREQGWLQALALGMALRLVALGATGLVALRLAERSRTEALIMGLVSFLFLLILLEAWFLRGATRSETTTNQIR